MAILSGKGVTKSFGGLTAVSNVDFHVNEGEVLGLIGPNGAGKSTLFNLISAALTPNRGEIIFKEKNITGIKPHKICHMGLARTFQNVKIFENLSVLENVLLGSYFGTKNRVSSVDAATTAGSILEFVSLDRFADQPAGSLSLASQKRLEVARAMATKPDVLMLDEVMEGLNPAEVTLFMALINNIREKGITVIMIEHVMKAIMSLCDRIMVLHHGAKIADGTPQEVANSETVMRVYLGDKAHAANKGS